MATITLTSGSAVVAPFALSEYTSDQDGGPITHDILGRVDPDVTLRPLGMRAGSFILDFATEAQSGAARQALSSASAWTLSHSDRPSIAMQFIVSRLSRPIRGGDGRWMITLSYQEIAP